MEDWAVRHVNDVVADELGWHFGRDPLPDYGVDAIAEVVCDDDLVTGRLLGIQVKGSEKRFSGARGTGWAFSDHNDHLAYWLSYSVPVIVVLVNKQREAFWQVVTPETVTERRERFSMTVPWHQPFDSTARAALLSLARRGGGMLETLPAHYAALPPAATGPLRRAEAFDHFGAARLAERLARGRGQPGLTAAMLVAAQPLWMVNSSAVQDLWLAVGVYAEQHGKNAEAGRAFAEAAQVPGPRTTRAAAAAGVAFLGSDRTAAREHLLKARAAGLVLPADAALSMLDLPEDDWRPPLIPPSVRAASRPELEEWPNVLAFLAEEAARRGSLDEAVGYAERAVECAGNQAAPLKLTLARYVQRRAAAGDMSARQSGRAARLAREVVDERRRWDGPSGEALAFLLDIQLPVDAAAAVREALPASEGGLATDAEAVTLEVASRGALAATIAGDTRAYEFFLSRLPDGPHRSEVLALQADQSGQPAAARIAVWSRVLEEAADHAMATWCIISLARLGHWPEKAEKMHDRGILPDDAYTVLKAICQCNAGDRALGLAVLRAMAETSAMAAGEFVALIEQLEGPGKAIEECERQAVRWHASALIQRLLDLHGRAGDPERAAELIGQVLPDDSFPAEARLSLCTWLTTRKCGEQKYADAVTVASRGLEIGDDPDLAWLLVKALFNDGKVTRARRVLSRYHLNPVGRGETQLWLMLHRGVQLSPDDARTMTAIARQETDPALREAAVGILAREVLHLPAGTAVAYDPDIAEEVTLLRDEAAARDDGGPSPTGQNGAVPAAGARAAEPQATHAGRLLREVQAGHRSQADIGRVVGLPYGAVLLRRLALIHPAADLRPGLRAAGEKAAQRALHDGACAADPSSLHLLSLLGADDQARIRSALRQITIAWPVIPDLVGSRDHLRNLSAAGLSVVLAPGDTTQVPPPDGAEQAALRDKAETLEILAASLISRMPAARQDPAADSITIAQETGLPLWCDDIALRQQARYAGVTAFSFLDLVTVLARQGIVPAAAPIIRRLAAYYVTDLPLTADDIIAIAGDTGWSIGPAHAALGRSAWWEHQSAGWVETWLAIAAASRRSSPGALTAITRAALPGAVSAVTPGLATRRHQELAVSTLTACHEAGLPAPEGLLGQLAEITGPAAAPRPQFVLAELDKELTRRYGPARDQ